MSYSFFWFNARKNDSFVTSKKPNMNRKKLLLGISFAFTVFSAKSQVGINTTQPKASLHIEKNTNTSFPDGLIIPKYTVSELAAKDSNYNAEQNGAFIFITAGVGVSGKTSDITGAGLYYYDSNTAKWVSLTSSNGITKTGNNFQLGGTLVKPTTLVTSSANTLAVNGLPVSPSIDDNLVVSDPVTGVLKTQTISKLGIPRPAIFQLDSNKTDFLKNVARGNSSNVPMSILVNNTGINGLTFNSSNNTITFKPGLYQITFVYEATHYTVAGQPDCKVSSYFVDFPVGSSSSQRIHSTAVHGAAPSTNNATNHGGTVTYTTRITANYDWVIQLGRGQSGDGGCEKTEGMTLVGKSTQLAILRVGD